MTFIPAPSCVKLSAIYDANSSRVQNSYCFWKSGGWTTNDMSFLGSNFIDWENVYGQPMRSAACSLVLVSVADMEVEGGTVVDCTTDLPLVGTAPDAAAPNNVTACVSWRTAKHGRSYRGRTYMVGLTVGAFTEDTFTSSALSAWRSAHQHLLDEVGLGLSAVMGVVSKYHNKAPREVAEFNPIISLNIDERVDSQRRRLLGRGA